MSDYRHCVTENAVDRQRQFENALLELMETKTLPQISIQEICSRVGLSRKSFYRYFSSKEDCLDALIDHTILELTDIPTQGEQMHLVVQRYFAYWGKHRDLLDALCRNDLSSRLMERAVLCAVQEFGIRDYLGERGDSYTQTIFFVSGLVGVLLDWHLSGCQKAPEQLAATLADFLPQYPHGVF